jgi:uncharacterized protein (DUF58 family)
VVKLAARARALARRARALFPLTALGAGVAVLSAIALVIGIRRVDLVLLGAASIGIVGLLLGLVTVSIAALGVRRALRRSAGTTTPLAIECGFAMRTGFALPRVRWLPGIRITWRWESPRADVRVLAAGARLEEEVLASARGWSESLTRVIEIGDAFGTSRIVLTHREERAVRMLPSVGGLKQMHVIRTLSGGSDIVHPEGSPDGERLDLRQYAPGDPIRFVLWSVFARTRELVVRTPERALSATRKTLAYLVAGAADEPALRASRSTSARSVATGRSAPTASASRRAPRRRRSRRSRAPRPRRTRPPGTASPGSCGARRSRAEDARSCSSPESRAPGSTDS